MTAPDSPVSRRAVFVVGKDGVIRYKQIVEELTDEPDYESVLDAVKESR